ncbi:MAG TPA: YdcF family protein [Trebonia sp.]
MEVITLGLAAVVFLVFLAGVAREPRSFGNAVLLGLALALGALGLAEHLHDEPSRAARLLLLALLLAVAAGPLLLGCFLLGNGVVMVRREGLRPVNLLSLVAGAAAFVIIGLDVAADQADDLKLSLFATAANLVFGYVSFLLVSYVCYAFCYGLLARTGRAEFVIVLGSGLRPDGGVPPLLASRLDRGRAVHAALDRRAAAAGAFRPLLIVSGGKGDDERVAEAAAMAAYLRERGVPAERLLLEDQSRSTEENLRFSLAIMDRLRPGARATIVTSDFHAFRAALIARRIGLRGQATGARVAGYYEPNAILREFAAVFLRYRVVNLGICALLVLVPVGAAALRYVR